MIRDSRLLMTLAATILLAAAPYGLARAGDSGTTRANWLLNRAALAAPEFPDARDFQSDVGSATPMSVETETGQGNTKGGGKVGWKMLASAVLPGSGEAMMGHTRGYVMMAVDIFAWTRVAKYDSDGNDQRDAYYAFADAHYSDALLVEGYKTGSTDIERNGEGAHYFPDVGAINDISELDNLPLYVTKEEDRREYYENLGKWDQFIFGWDDYLNPRGWAADYDYTPDDINPITDLRQPWVSKNRESYRRMREESNDSFKKRDRWLYVNIGLRVFSVIQTAWLGGLLGGGDEPQMAVAGHPVELVMAPAGPYRGRVGAKVWF